MDSADTACGSGAINAPNAGDRGYGGFRLGALALALPMAALREVVPLGELSALPCAARCVLGAIRLRGAAVPVLDLRRVLGLDDSACAPHPSVIIVVHEACLLGLLVDGVTGVFDCPPGGFHRTVSRDPLAALLAGSIQRDDDQALVSVLSPAALAALPGVPMVQDPEPSRQPAQDAGDAVAVHDPSSPVMLVRCGTVPLAIDAMAVHATLPSPRIDSTSVLALGHCRGVIDYAGSAIPALDLLALCGLGHSSAPEQGQAFVLNIDGGLVAFLVDEVVDVVRVHPRDRVRIPGFALQRAALFAGALPTAALPADVQERTSRTATQYLLIDPAALRACPDVAGLAATNTRSDGSTASSVAGFARAANPGAGRCSMITYALGGETATPIAQVAEILHYRAEAPLTGGNAGLLGLVVNRGRAIPVMCLASLTGRPPADATETASVLVVESAGELVGFAVPHLQSIEDADWADWADDSATRQTPQPRPLDARPLDTRRLARVGPANQHRLLPVLDLLQMARQLQAGAAA